MCIQEKGDFSLHEAVENLWEKYRDNFNQVVYVNCRSQWPRGVRNGSAVTYVLGSWFRILPGAWMSVCCECCVFSGRILCDELITRSEEAFRLCVYNFV
jgi:hypothetical protein